MKNVGLGHIQTNWCRGDRRHTNVQRTDRVQHQKSMSRVAMVMEFISLIILV